MITSEIHARGKRKNPSLWYSREAILSWEGLMHFEKLNTVNETTPKLFESVKDVGDDILNEVFLNSSARIPADSIIGMRDIQTLALNGDTTAALGAAEQNWRYLDANPHYGISDPMTLRALGNLLNTAVHCQDTRRVSLDMVTLFAEQAMSPDSGLGPLRMQLLTHLCEYSARFGHANKPLQEIAEQSLAQLHHIYPLAKVGEEARRYAAEICLLAATDIVIWKTANKKPDLRGIDYIASNAEQRLAQFAPLDSQFLRGLYEMRRGRVESALNRFDGIIQANPSQTTPVHLAALEAAFQGYVLLGDLQTAEQRTLHLKGLYQSCPQSDARTRGLARCERYQFILACKDR